MPTTPIEVDVSTVVPFVGRHVVRGWIHTPPAPLPDRPTLVACCLAGGTCTTRYFDLHVDGHPGYSMAEQLAAHGIVTVAFDHLGIGTSSAVDDVFLATPQLVSAVNDFAHRAALERVGAPETRVVIGLGHSMGGMLATVQQARHATFDAVVVLGHGGDGLPAVLTPDEACVHGSLDDVTDRIVALARERFSRPVPIERRGVVPGSFLADDVPMAVRRAFVDQQTSLLYTCGLTSMIPKVTDADKAAIRVPVFVGFGDHDLTDEYEAGAARYPGSPDVKLFVLEGSAHCHNQASSRADLWDQIVDWTYTVMEAG